MLLQTIIWSVLTFGYACAKSVSGKGNPWTANEIEGNPLLIGKLFMSEELTPVEPITTARQGRRFVDNILESTAKIDKAVKELDAFIASLDSNFEQTMAHIAHISNVVDNLSDITLSEHTSDNFSE